VAGHDRHGEWRDQAADDQVCSSGKANGPPTTSR
jgi:hypothetical protein